MITCLITLIIYAIVCVILAWIIETLLNTFLAPPPPIIALIRCLFGLLLLVWVLDCIGIVPGVFRGHP
jgi:hypothetical protein